MNVEKEIKTKLIELLVDGYQILINYGKSEQKIIIQKIEIKKEKNPETLKISYNNWYSIAVPFIKQILPERLEEFENYYKAVTSRKHIDVMNYSISDYITGITVQNSWEDRRLDHQGVFQTKFQNQLAILGSSISRIDNILSNLTEVIQANIIDSEILVARDLHRKKHIRAAGAISGVVIEKHFDKLITLHNIQTTKKNLHISDYNELLKKNNIYDVPMWRFVQRMGDIRNLCVHSSDRDPTIEEVEELINGADRIVKTVH